ncbi:MAG: formate/nitrite transporter family protein [Oligosphaeraceae bacterium]
MCSEESRENGVAPGRCAALGRVFLEAALSGLFIGIAGTVYLSVEPPALGAFLFAFGLMTILCRGFKLYTGAIGYLVVQGRATVARYLGELAVIWGGNLAGCVLVGALLRRSRVYPALASRLAPLCQAKLTDGWGSLLILSFFCGILMYLAVDTYRRQEIPVPFRLATVFLCVVVFILCGFEHCVANMYYFSAAGVWGSRALGKILLMTLGNSLGGFLLPLADRFRTRT